MLENQRDNLLAFAAGLDRDLAALAREWRISVTTAREVLQVQSLPTWAPERWRREAVVREALRGRYHGARAAVHAIAALKAGTLEVAPLQSYFQRSF